MLGKDRRGHRDAITTALLPKRKGFWPKFGAFQTDLEARRENIGIDRQFPQPFAQGVAVYTE